MAETGDLKSLQCGFESHLGHSTCIDFKFLYNKNMDIDNLLEQIEFHNSSYEWIVRESEKVALELKKLDRQKNFDADGYEAVVKKFMELENRYKRNKKEYDSVVNMVREYFNEKHGIDIIGILDNSEDTAK